MLNLSSKKWIFKGELAAHHLLGPMLSRMFGHPKLWSPTKVSKPSEIVTALIGSRDFLQGYFASAQEGGLDFYVRRPTDMPIERWQRYRIEDVNDPNLWWKSAYPPVWMESCDKPERVEPTGYSRL